MAREEEKLKLGKGAAFVKSELKRLPQEDETWEADFEALPKPITQSQTHYLGMVVTQPDAFVLADAPVEGRPTVNELATLLANAMSRPQIGSAHRPKAIHVRGAIPSGRGVLAPGRTRHWNRCSARTAEGLGSLRAILAAHPGGPARRHGQTDRQAGQRRESCSRPSLSGSERRHIEIHDGDQGGSQAFIVRAIDCGGQIFEDTRPKNLAEALAALEKGLRKWFAEEGIELEEPG